MTMTGALKHYITKAFILFSRFDFVLSQCLSGGDTNNMDILPNLDEFKCATFVAQLAIYIVVVFFFQNHAAFLDFPLIGGSSHALTKGVSVTPIFDLTIATIMLSIAGDNDN
jgi:hypothetical protein